MADSLRADSLLTELGPRRPWVSIHVRRQALCQTSSVTGTSAMGTSAMGTSVMGTEDETSRDLVAMVVAQVGSLVASDDPGTATGSLMRMGSW